MATLVLTAIGSAIGGPIGGAIGAAIGQQVDHLIFAPKPREGARLKELSVQTSSYGSQIPAIFGAMRVAGTVIWATDLIEKRAKSGGGKGRPSTVSYSYSVSMAVALSSRPIARIGRIWADGNLLRGSAGDLKVDTQLRIYNGYEDQPLDPLMASAEQAGQCPAHRGIAYALFEDLQLADYGNRIPSLTFEVFERDEKVPVGVIFEAATAGAIQGTSSNGLVGFALSGASARAPLTALLDVLPIELGVRDGALKIRDAWSGSSSPAILFPAVREGQTEFDAPRRKVEPAGNFPENITLRYYDRSRDFQASLQRSTRGQFAETEYQIELPAVLSAPDAKYIVEHRHILFQNERNSWQGTVAASSQALSPGDKFLDESGNIWRIGEIEYRFGSLEISAHLAGGDSPLTGGPAAPGRGLPSPDLIVGETRLALFELPAFGADDPGKPMLAVFASGTGSAWKRAALSLSEGEALLNIGVTALPAVMGSSLEQLRPHNVNLIDEAALLQVRLLNEAMDIAERAGSPIDADAPYFWLDGEFIRYGNCEALGSGVYRFSRLRRGCFQSYHSVLPHPEGARFVLIEPESARIIEERIFVAGEIARLESIGVGDSEPVSASALVQGIAIKPLAPVHGTVVFAADGSVVYSWVRRSRIDMGWRDGVEQMLAEQQEQYLFSLSANAVPLGSWVVFESNITFSAERWAEFEIAENVSVRAEIRQVGRHAQSDPLPIKHP